MTFAEYFLVILAMFSHYFIGSFFTNGPASLKIFFGILISGGVLASTIWFVPNLTKEIVLIAIISSAIYFFLKQKKMVNIKVNYLYLFSLFFSFILFNHFSYHNYIFNNHDVFYWGYTFESLIAEYSGRIRAPTFYPNELTITHVLPYTSLSSILILISDVNLVKIIQAKYLLVSFLFGSIIYELVKNNQKNIIKVFVCFLCLIMIFEFEIGYNILTTSYLYQLLLFYFFIIIFYRPQLTKELLFLSSFMIIARAPIFYIGVIVYLYLLYKNKDLFFTKSNIFTLIVIFIVMLTWIIIPHPYQLSDPDVIKFNLVNPFSIDDLTTIIGIRLWVFPDLIGNFLLKHTEDFDLLNLLSSGNYSDKIYYIFLTTPFIVYIFVKYYLPFYIFKKNFNSTISNNYNAISYLALISILGWVFIRNGIQISHQTHSYILFSSVAFLSLFFLCIKYHLLYYFIIFLALWFFFFDGVRNNLFEVTFTHGIPMNGIPYIERKNKKLDFYYPPTDESMWLSELNALKSGQRIKCRSFSNKTIDYEFSGSDNSTSIMPNFINFPHNKKCLE